MQVFAVKRVEVVQEVEGERLQGALEWLVAAVQDLQARPAPVEPPPDHTEEIERLKAQARELGAAVEELRGGVAAADAKAGAAGERAQAAEARVAEEAARLDAEVAALREAQEQAEVAAARLAERVDTKAEQADLDATRGDLARGLARVDAAEGEIVKLWEAIRACEARLDDLAIPEPLPPLPPVEIPLPPAGDGGGVDFGALLRPLQEAIASNRHALEALSAVPARVDRAEVDLGGLAKRVAALEGDVSTLAGKDMQEKANLADLPAGAPAAAPTDLGGLEAAVAELREDRDALRRDVAAAFEDLEVKRIDIEELRALLQGKADLDALSTLKMHFAGLSVGGGEGSGELNSGMLDAFQDALASKADKDPTNVALDQLWAEVRACQQNVRQAREEVERVREEEVRPLCDRADAADRALEGLEERKADRTRVQKDLEERADLEDHLALRDEVAALKLLLASLRPGEGGGGGDGMLDALNAAMATKADRTATDSLAEDLEALRVAYMAHLSSTEDEGSHVRLLKSISDLWDGHGRPRALRALQEVVEGLPHLLPAEGSLSAVLKRFDGAVARVDEPLQDHGGRAPDQAREGGAQGRPEGAGGGAQEAQRGVGPARPREAGGAAGEQGHPLREAPLGLPVHGLRPAPGQARAGPRALRPDQHPGQPLQGPHPRARGRLASRLPQKARQQGRRRGRRPGRRRRGRRGRGRVRGEGGRGPQGRDPGGGLGGRRRERRHRNLPRGVRGGPPERGRRRRGRGPGAGGGRPGRCLVAADPEHQLAPAAAVAEPDVVAGRRAERVPAAGPAVLPEEAVDRSGPHLPDTALTGHLPLKDAAEGRLRAQSAPGGLVRGGHLAGARRVPGRAAAGDLAGAPAVALGQEIP